MLWGFFFPLKVLKIVLGHMSSIKYENILNQNQTVSSQTLQFGCCWIFKPENDVNQKWLIDHRIKLLPWLSQSPDLNPIKNRWHELKRRVHERRLRILDGLVRFCKEECLRAFLCILQGYKM